MFPLLSLSGRRFDKEGFILEAKIILKMDGFSSLLLFPCPTVILC